MVTAKPKLMTADELLLLEGDDGRYDLIHGELYQMPPAGEVHALPPSKLNRAVVAYLLQNDIGDVFVAETGFVLARDPDIVVAPDLAFIRHGRLSSEPQSGFLELAPDLAVEVVSPYESRARVETKAQAYLAAGGSLVWAVWPLRRTVVVYEPDQPPRELTDADTLDGGDILPGFTLPVAAIFR